MYSKRTLPVFDGVHDSKRLRDNLNDLFMSNIASAERTLSLHSDASLLEGGKSHIPFAKMSGKKNDKKNKNLHRNLMRRC